MSGALRGSTLSATITVLVARSSVQKLGTVMACEEAKLPVDFYMKTHHSTNYWSTRRPDQTLDVVVGP